MVVNITSSIETSFYARESHMWSRDKIIVYSMHKTVYIFVGHTNPSWSKMHENMKFVVFSPKSHKHDSFAKLQADASLEKNLPAWPKHLWIEHLLIARKSANAPDYRHTEYYYGLIMVMRWLNLSINTFLLHLAIRALMSGHGR